MQDYIEQRVVEIGRYILKYGSTVRSVAGVFGVSKSTVHKDMTERLPLVNPILAAKVRKILDINKSERHLRGGEATRIKFMQKNLL